MKRTTPTAFLIASLAVGAAACGTSTASTSADGRTSGKPSATPAAREDSGTRAPVDACTLLKPADVTPVIGKNDGGRPTSGVGESVCGWENPDTYHSITVSVGGPGTAAAGRLKDEPGATGEAGPDGIRFLSGGVARFAAGDRDCQVQVVTAAGADDRSTAVKLVGLLRDRI
ncbi:hypothetical protein AB0D30_17910 [Streptomyces sp. NPDC048409]|uniref:hypothetical protein n=1 Tax=Streptomyces sp. NPDC048409 TaxID=3154723 RepID=UPI00344073ED